jgi:hypothetical protein
MVALAHAPHQTADAALPVVRPSVQATPHKRQPTGVLYSGGAGGRRYEDMMNSAEGQSATKVYISVGKAMREYGSKACLCCVFVVCYMPVTFYHR